MNRTGFLALWVTALLGGCSLVNSFDDVAPLAEGSGGRPGQDAGTGGRDAAVDADLEEAAAGGSVVTDATADAADAADAFDGSDADAAPEGSAGAGGAQDAGEDAFVPGGPNGAIVAYDGDKVWVLDPEDGSGLSNQDLGTIAAIAHDPSTDYWYLFEQTGTLDEAHVLHVRELNTTNGQWRELGTAMVPAPATSTGVGILNERMAYLSYPPTGRQTRFTVLNTSDPTDTKVVGTANRDLPSGAVIELVAAPGRDIGGLFTVMLQECFTGSTLDGGATSRCDVKLASFIVSAGPIVSPSSAGNGGVQVVGEVSTLGGGAGLTFDPLDQALVVVLPPNSGIGGNAPACAISPTSDGTVTRYSPSTLSPVGAPISFKVGTRRIQRVAPAPCVNSVVTSTFQLDNALFVVPFQNGGTTNKQCVPDVTGALVYEPFTRIILRAVDGDLQGWTVDGTKAAPTIERKTLSRLPNNFETSIFAVRQQSNTSCN